MLWSPVCTHTNLFIPSQKFALGNVLRRLKLVCAFIMLKHGKNPNTFAKNIPDDFKENNFTIEDLEGLANELGPTERLGDQDASVHEDNEESESPEPDQPEEVFADNNDSQVADQPSPGCSRLQPFAPSHSKKVKPPGPVTISQPVPEDIFIEMDFSRDTATSVQSDV